MVKQGKLPLDAGEPRLTLATPENDKSAEISSAENVSDRQPSDEPILAVEVLEMRQESDPNLYVESDEDEYANVGTRLRFERERQGYSVHDIAEQLRLRPRQVQALEDGNYDALPGQTFVAGFLRSYANALGLDAVAVVDLYKSEYSGEVGVPELAFPEPTSEGRMPASSLLIGCCVVAVLVVAGWYFYLNENSLEIEIVPDLPDRLSEKLESSRDAIFAGIANITSSPKAEDANAADAADAADAKDAIAVSTEITKPKAVRSEADEETLALNQVTELVTEPKPLITSVKDIDKPEAQLEPQAVAALPKQNSTNEILAPAIMQKVETEKVEVTSQLDPSSKTVLPTSEIVENVEVEAAPIVVAAVPTKTYFPQQKLNANNSVSDSEGPASLVPAALGVENKDARLVLVARQESWVHIKVADKETVLDRILAAGDTFMLPSKPNMILSTANAAGLEIRLDGSSLGMLGGYGEIIQALSLDPEQLKEKLSASN